LSCHDVAALLALVGLTAELIAIVLILRSVGVGDPTVRRVRSMRVRLSGWARRIWPWSKPGEPQYVDISPAEEVNVAESVRVTQGRSTEGPPPRDFEEVGVRFNEIAADLNYLDSKIDQREDQVKEELRDAVAGARSEAAAQQKRLDEEVESEIRTRLSERKAEGTAFAAGSCSKSSAPPCSCSSADNSSAVETTAAICRRPASP
jgi:outer membrane murein-binding lipoprotein Lpp